VNLKDELMEIDGVGEKTAEKILSIIDTRNDPKLQKAIQKAQEHNDREASIWLRRYSDQ